MSKTILEHMHKDLEEMKQDMALIKNILIEEGKLTDYAKDSLREARTTPASEYIKHDDLRKKILR